ncbi:MAG: hypothetical protein KGN32_14020 [Burkholderiales bacterium]|nr:hypothetical protein [Burkholderiales bacterium]
MKLTTKIAQIVLVLGTVPVAALAGDMGTVYTQLGTNGLGLGYARSVSQDWAVRGQYNTLNLSYTGDLSDTTSSGSADLKIKFDSVQLLGDWYPGDGGFRVSGGVVFNNNKITVNGTGTVNNVPNQTINAEIKMSDGIAPYVGIGYSTRPKDAKGFGFTYDLGMMFQNPKASLTSSASASDTAAQLAKMQDAVDKLKVMPAFSIGFSYSF